MLINGKWVSGSTNDYIFIKNPATSEIISKTPNANEEDINNAVISSKNAFTFWKHSPVPDRVEIMHRAAKLIREKIEELSLIITLEMGKPIKKSRSEVSGVADLFDYFAEEGLRLTGDMPMLNYPNEYLMILKEPVGVIGIITPSNYPLALLTWKLGPALMCGCTIVAKPDEGAPTVVLKLGQIFLDSGLPEGVFNIVTGDGQKTGTALIRHPKIDKIAFTGSPETGRIIAATAAQNFTRISLELGGQCPAIVMDDIMPLSIINNFVSQTFNNSGQYCYRINRAYIHEKIYDEFINVLINETKKIRVGNGIDEKTDIGPLINERIFLKTTLHVKDAIDKGAKISLGGYRLLDEEFKNGYFYLPTIIEGANKDMLIMSEETFGPAIGICKVKSLDEAIRLSNDSRYGLAAFLFTNNIKDGLKAINQLEAGSIWVNRIHKAYEVMPFGGMKQSGYGREKSKYGFNEYLELKSVYLTLPND